MTIIILLVVLAVFVGLINIVVLINKRVFAATEHLPRLSKILKRSISLTLTCGVGIIGGEGFALPGPLLGALIFYNGPKYYWMTALMPAAVWFAIFFLGQLLHSRGKKNQTTIS